MDMSEIRKAEEIKLISEENGTRIDAWLSKMLDKYSRSYIQKLINDGLVLVNGTAVKSNYKVRMKDDITVQIPEPEVLDIVPEDIDVPILYEDEHIIVVDKPKGMVVHPAAGNYSGTLVNALMKHCGDNLSSINGVIRPGIVHRIDKDTSGVLVVAKSNEAHEKLSMMLKEHDINRVYIALVHGIIREEAGKIDAPIGRHPVDRKKMAVNTKNGRRAVTHFKVLERFKDATMLEVKLETGRTHQIRVHMSYIGYPIIGDTVYGRKKDKYNIEGQALHAKLLGFVHPITNEYMEFESELPEYFVKLLEELRRN
ncbi:RluA family pseudouridine synthase [Acetivibrio clariflavus]|uniref:Pseudouridine synthase n=1 Tax=Acetivibrio clariflavus (strain DSM 19732 / NBRC 101661 / EBR45) TaxID=720554 RepID=G8LWQ8_ACECE|nr:pseudouridine synthase, RluA family [Acetivibrio clariflavus DSM 19732]